MSIRLLIAAPGSGSGKTTFTIGLLSALKQRGLDVGAFKCGPDYIDPMFHKSVLHIPSTNLDLFFNNEEELVSLYGRKEREVNVIEGVMGLYDGLAGMEEEASSYHVAKTLDCPIVLVINARGMARSLLALIHGFLAMDSSHLIRGIVLNQMSGMLYPKMKEAIEKECGVSVYGYLPKMDIAISSRYLGLQLPEELEDLQDRIECVTKQIFACIDIDGLLSIGKKKSLKQEEEKEETHFDLRLAYSKDEAFCFEYDANVELLEKLGVTLVPFSPIHDKSLPENIQGLLLTGGYPELYKEELQKNESMRSSIRLALESNLPCLAECGGFMYLHKKIEDCDMVGLIEGECKNTGKLTRFGYVYLQGNDQIMKAHSFHYYDSSCLGNELLVSKPKSSRTWRCGYIGKDHLYSFAHLYYPSNKEFIVSFLESCEVYGK
ncbi:MAG: cobyrinate a,c-diamide synthase, partial [Firmicutes bacterium]|nr:cobyrinate a,c-diamide synthase [Bacillota bacterium]